MNWFGFIILSTVLYGIMNFIYKSAAEKGCSSRVVINRASVTVSILALITIIINKEQFTNLKWILIYALLNSSFYATGAFSKIKALKYIKASVAFPLTKLNAVFIIITAFIFFGDRPNISQWIGILLSIIMLFFVREKGKSKIEKRADTKGILLAVSSALCTAVSMLVGKFAAENVNKINYIFLSYLFVSGYTYILLNIKTHGQTNSSKTASKSLTVFFGILIGILNYAGYACLLMAFDGGPLSLIQAIFSTSIVIPIILSIIVFKEKLNTKNITVIILSVLAIIFIKVNIFEILF